MYIIIALLNYNSNISEDQMRMLVDPKYDDDQLWFISHGIKNNYTEEQMRLITNINLTSRQIKRIVDSIDNA